MPDDRAIYNSYQMPSAACFPDPLYIMLYNVWRIKTSALIEKKKKRENMPAGLAIML